MNMIPNGGLLDFHPITPENARTLITSFLADSNVIHAVGHEQTAKLASNQLRREGENIEDIVKFARIPIQLHRGDDLLLCQYIGPRLPEGTTVLPEGSEIRWYYIHWYYTFPNR